jgi:serine/threonine-protein kinase
MTSTGMLLGTPAFMAPEQALGKSVDICAQTDLWSASATLFTLLSGQYVHSGENAAQLLIQAGTARARSLATAVGDVPFPIVQVVDRGLAFGVAERWPSAAAMRGALREASVSAFGAIPERFRPDRTAVVGPVAPPPAPTEPAALSTGRRAISGGTVVGAVEGAGLPMRSISQGGVVSSTPFSGAGVAPPLPRTGGTTAQPVSVPRDEESLRRRDGGRGVSHVLPRTAQHTWQGFLAKPLFARLHDRETSLRQEDAGCLRGRR